MSSFQLASTGQLCRLATFPFIFFFFKNKAEESSGNIDLLDLFRFVWMRSQNKRKISKMSTVLQIISIITCVQGGIVLSQGFFLALSWFYAVNL